MKKEIPQVIVSAIEHKHQQWIALQCKPLQALNDAIKLIPGRMFSYTYKQWLIPYSKEHYVALKKALEPIATIDETALKAYAKALKNKAVKIEKKDTKSQVLNKEQIDNKNGLDAIDPLNKKVLVQMKQYLQLKSYSLNTQRTYLNEMSQFLQKIGKVPADSFSNARIKDYLAYCYEKLQLSENTLHSRMNALKFYYEQVLKRERFFWDIPRPKKPMQLPKLLNEQELAKLFNALSNKKHKAMLFTAYSAGLRVSEIAALQIHHIDSGRMQILIENAKGKKDRYVALSPILLDILRDYIKNNKPKPKKYLFESEQTGEAYPTRTIQQIFSNAKRKAGITKEVGIHSLRHSFATHLLEKGTDIRFIKDLLGHFNIKTTERYLHVSKKQLVNFSSPLDDLFLNGKLSLK